MNPVVVYKIRKPILVIDSFTCDPAYAEQKQREGYVINGYVIDRNGLKKF